MKQRTLLHYSKTENKSYPCKLGTEEINWINQLIHTEATLIKSPPPPQLFCFNVPQICIVWHQLDAEVPESCHTVFSCWKHIPCQILRTQILREYFCHLLFLWSYEVYVPFPSRNFLVNMFKESSARWGILRLIMDIWSEKLGFFFNLIVVHKHELKYMNRAAIKTKKCYSKYRYAISQSTCQINYSKHNFQFRKTVEFSSPACLEANFFFFCTNAPPPPQLQKTSFITWECF